ncbi:hypothetical protein MUK42_16255 [Musa troglodytarum]|uniref:Acyl carrier protein n=1 Tax=Musa troglodytarum TaxID=320322 RepID=A0A9E7HHZ6_9LILI|nr:hypothetical protein MUK42_16255 [Musa troglodytarum]
MRQQLSIRVVHLQCMHPRSLLHGALPSSLRFALAAGLSLTLLHLPSTHGFSRWDDDLDLLSPVALAAEFSSLKSISFSSIRKSFPAIQLRPASSRLRICCAVEIVMGLEEAFGISVEEESAQRIVTVQDAADLIQELVEAKSC